MGKIDWRWGVISIVLSLGITYIANKLRENKRLIRKGNRITNEERKEDITLRLIKGWKNMPWKLKKKKKWPLRPEAMSAYMIEQGVEALIIQIIKRKGKMKIEFE